jgi:hypothetical protein
MKVLGGEYLPKVLLIISNIFNVNLKLTLKNPCFKANEVKFFQTYDPCNLFAAVVLDKAGLKISSKNPSNYLHYFGLKFKFLLTVIKSKLII